MIPQLATCYLLQVFEEVDPSLKVEWAVSDGDVISYGMKFGTVKGSGEEHSLLGFCF
jgi:nicotinate-nucleotide pyrophosphorylase